MDALALKALKASGFEYKKALGLWEADSRLKRAYAKPHGLCIPAQRQKFERILDQTYLLILENLSKRQEATGISLRTQILVAVIWGAHSTMRTIVLASTILELSP